MSIFGDHAPFKNKLLLHIEYLVLHVYLQTIKWEVHLHTVYAVVLHECSAWLWIQCYYIEKLDLFDYLLGGQ